MAIKPQSTATTADKALPAVNARLVMTDVPYKRRRRTFSESSGNSQNCRRVRQSLLIIFLCYQCECFTPRLPPRRRLAPLFDTETEIPNIDIVALSQRVTTNGLSMNTNAINNSTTDIPLPTEKGGFSHTTASKAKISAANKGNVPWNKGKKRSPETRARIAAGVRAKNRQRFLDKLQEMGLTEAEYNEKQREEARQRQAERRARKTPNGGYRPTTETRQKISRVLKAKYKSGEIKARTGSTNSTRKGFKHSEETRRRISESLKKRWATDEEYRMNMMNHQGSDESVRRKISETLRKKWQDPTFRATMLEKINKSRPPAGSSLDKEHRAKISASIKAKWQDEEYRKKTLESIASRKSTTTIKSKSTKPKAKGEPSSKSPSVSSPKRPKKIKGSKLPTKSTAATNSPRVARKGAAPKKSTKAVASTTKKAKKSVEKTVTPKKEPKRKRNGNIDLLKEERRDLYDLLYGDDEEHRPADDDEEEHRRTKFSLEDENLDAFDPYGLQDF